MKSNKLKLVYWLILLICFVIFFVFKTIKFETLSKGETKEIPVDYLNLFSDRFKEKIISQTTFLYSSRYPVSLATYNDSFNLVIYKMDVRKRNPLPAHIAYTKENEHGGSVSYIESGNGKFKYRFALDPDKSVEDIMIAGNSVPRKYLENDSSAFYSFLLKRVYIKYNASKNFDFKIEDTENQENIDGVYTELMLLRKDNFLYIVILASEYEKIAFSQILSSNVKDKN